MFNTCRWLITALALALVVASCAKHKPIPPPAVANLPLPMTDAKESPATETTPTGQPQPPTLAAARAAYIRAHTLNDTIKSYTLMLWAFKDDGWYDRALDVCADIEQRFPGDREHVMLIQLLRARILADQGRWQKAYATVDAVDARYRDVHTPLRVVPMPLSIYAHMNARRTKIDLLTEERKYREAAAVSDQLIAERLTPSDAVEKQYVAAHQEGLEYSTRVGQSAHSAWLYYQAGKYSTAVTRYADIRSYMSTHRGQSQSKTDAFTYHYVLPVQTAMCQMKLARYAEALQTYREVERVINSPTKQEEIFMKIGTEYTGMDTKDLTAVAYFSRVDLPLRLAECLIRLNEKRRAQRALNMARTQLDAAFAAKIQQRDTSLVSFYEIADRRVDAPWITELQTAIIPALQQQIDKL